ncbi:hypothetical protein [Paenibacillus sp. MBLB4367]|uniref:hypothetical protein n=1 Tax=Paenibacillus sp. MBLB4367 TaxID=3384767 RepID=UPI0039080164
MPDWSYQTLFRPLLFRLPARTARDLTLGAMGALSRFPGGALVIRTLGHAELPSILGTEIAGIPLRSPVGLSGGLDVHGTGRKALSQFGIGYVEIGPVTAKPITDDRPIIRDDAREELLYPNAYVNDGVDAIALRLVKERAYANRHDPSHNAGHNHKPGKKPPYLFRVAHTPGLSPELAFAEQRFLLETLAPYADGFILDATVERSWTSEQTAGCIAQIGETLHSLAPSLPVMLYIPLDCPPPLLETLLLAVKDNGYDGVSIGDFIRTESGDTVGRSGKQPCLELLRRIREISGSKLPILASAGIHEPQDAIDLMQAGADSVHLHSGFVYSGPGLAKRINEAAVYERVRSTPAPAAPSFWRDWGWMCLLGLGMLVGGLLAWWIAATSVVLPYDVSYLNMNRTMLEQLNSRLLPFMSHDRLTLAGTMMSIGILYGLFALFGLRRRQHWAKTALLTSGAVGFSSFFLFLGYGYFDPLHALVAIILFPMFLLSMRSRADQPSRKPPNRYNDRSWKRAQWGQLMLVSLGFAFAAGGAVIAWIGMNGVFVPTDLVFLCTTPEMLSQLNERLIPLIAHDRAGFGGALFADAIAILASALWGINQGERWLWWTLLIGGLPGFVAAFGVHLAIGYTDLLHLLPPLVAFALYIAGLVLLYPYMTRVHINPQHEKSG